MSEKKELSTTKIYGFELVSSRVGELLEILEREFGLSLSKSRLELIFTPNPEMVVRSRSDKAFARILAASDYNIPDGVGMVLLARFWAMLGVIPFGECPKERISGADLSWELGRILAARGGRVFLLGGSAKVNIKARLKLQSEMPGIKVAGEPGYLGIPLDDAVETERVIKLINKFEPDVLLVAFGQVRQESWLVENASRIKARYGVGVGGTFDYWAGAKKRAPRLIRSVGLEWLWRLCIEPGRLLRILAAVVVFPVVGSELIWRNRAFRS